jgi:hypothetical protein
MEESMKKERPRNGIEAIEQLAQNLRLLALSSRQQMLETQTRYLPPVLTRSA